jgi:dTDP-L-rhamnose 4-epimerase
MRVLISGGAGFIGSFLAEALLQEGHAVRIVDNLEEQVHHGKKPAYLPKEAEFTEADIRDRDVWMKALSGIDAVIHCASAVGVGQSQYEIGKYTDVNAVGTANLLDVLANSKHTVKQILLPTSMTAYGEGVYECKTHGIVRPGIRPEAQLQRKEWEPQCPECRKPLKTLPTPEDALKFPASVYAITKNVQEELVFSFGRTYGVKTAALRLFNVYGPRQSLSNPYTGVTAIFLSRLKNKQQPVIYEDGLQTRDFISVHDVVQAFLLALKADAADGKAFNIGSGVPTTIVDIAKTLSTLTGIAIEPKVTGEFRKNDIRHCFADTAHAEKVLGWKPKVSFGQGMKELVEWGEGEKAEDRFKEAEQDLISRNITQ